ncbi:MAG TPA: methyltransferase domain-containing protein [Baekduia sp.]|nr:methyltransferase domain-containing protein [Baekduia sp.]
MSESEDASRTAAEEQAALWNGPAGDAWVQEQAVLDAMFKPVEDLLVDWVCTNPGSHVLDVGCGTGATTIAVARGVGPDGRSVGIDISQPMITLARARAEQAGSGATFICASAQDHDFDGAAFDTIISRFGVMFFGDFARAFANLRGAATDDARANFIVWRGAAENPFMTTAEHAAAPLLPDLPSRRPDGPGQFAFADPESTRRVLEQGGWADIEIRPIDVTCALPESGLMGYVSRLGPLALALREADERTRAKVIETVRRAFDPYVDGAEVSFTAACWTVQAKAGV